MQNFTRAVTAITNAFAVLDFASQNNALDSPAVQQLNSTFIEVGLSLADTVAALNTTLNKQFDVPVGSLLPNATIVEVYQILFKVAVTVIQVR